MGQRWRPGRRPGCFTQNLQDDFRKDTLGVFSDAAEPAYLKKVRIGTKGGEARLMVTVETAGDQQSILQLSVRGPSPRISPPSTFGSGRPLLVRTALSLELSHLLRR